MTPQPVLKYTDGAARAVVLEEGFATAAGSVLVPSGLVKERRGLPAGPLLGLDAGVEVGALRDVTLLNAPADRLPAALDGPRL
ncbi:MAG TPA: hypothetical protein VN969_22215 [Streptosporangiaceae bacterium]|nr:hypothetical protein [Streptosporangiaceae bacterium]